MNKYQYFSILYSESTQEDISVSIRMFSQEHGFFFFFLHSLELDIYAQKNVTHEVPTFSGTYPWHMDATSIKKSVFTVNIS